MCESRLRGNDSRGAMADLWKRGTGLGDERLDGRAALMLAQVVATHSLVLNRLGGDRAGAVAAGRLLASAKVEPDSLLAPEIARTQAAVRGRRIVCAQDTTEINFSGRDKRRRGLGPGGDGVSKGFFMHPVLAIDAEAEAVLGIVAARIWTRENEPTPEHHGQAFEDKESARWLQGAEWAADRCAGAQSIVVVGDRESDIFEVFARKPAGIDLIVRAAQDRGLATDRAAGAKLFATLAGFDVLGSGLVRVAPKGLGDKGRVARVVIRSGRAMIAQPKRRRRNEADPHRVELGFVEVCEVEAPDGVTPLLWRLATTLPVVTLAEACEIVRLYRLRWRIEETFRTLKKDGMQLEATQVQEAHAVMNLAALGLAAAVRIVQLVDARDGSPRPATDLIDATDIANVERISGSREGATLRQKNPWAKGSLAWLSWTVARLGGWNCYYKPPGPKTMAHGWNRLTAMLDGMRLSDAGSDV